MRGAGIIARPPADDRLLGTPEVRASWLFGWPEDLSSGAFADELVTLLERYLRRPPSGQDPGNRRA